MIKLKSLQLENSALREQVASLEAQLAAVRLGANEFQEENPTQFQTLFETMELGAVYQAVDGSITLANPAAERILGLSLDEMQGRKSVDPRWRAIHPDGSAFPGEQHPAMQALRTGKVINDVMMGVYHPRKNEYRWIMINAVPEFHAGDDKPYRVYTTFADITTLKTAQNELQELSRSLEERVLERTAEVQDLYDNAPVGYHSVDKNGYIILINQTELDWLGYTREELVGVKHYRDLLTPPSQQIFDRNFPRLKAKEQIKDVEIDVIRKDGSLMPVLFNGGAVHDRDGKFVQSRSSILDITERKKSEAALRESETRFRTLFHNAPMSGVIYRLIRNAQNEIIDWEIQDINGPGAADLGHTPAELIGKRVVALFSAEVMTPYFELCRNVIVSNQPQHIETHFAHNDKHYLTGVFAIGSEHYANVSVDITKRKQAEENLRESEAKFSAAFNLSPLCLEIASLEGKIVDVNQTFSNLIGFSRAEMLGKDNAALGSRVVSDREMIDTQIAQSGGILRNLEARFRARDGSQHDILFSTNPIMLHGAPHLLFAGVEITERKQAEAARRESEEKFRAIIETSPDAIGLFGPGGVALMMNPAAVTTFGYANSAEMTSKNALEFFLPEDQARAAVMIQQVLSSGAVQNVEFRLLRKDRSWFYAEFSCSALYDANGSPKGIVSVTRDVTARKQAEAALRDSNEIAQAIINSATDGIFLIEVNGKVLAANEMVATKLGLSLADLIGANIYEHIPAEMAAARKEQVAAAARDHRPVFFEDERFGIWQENRIYPVIDGDGQVRRVAVYWRDVTARKQAEEELRLSEEKYRGLMESLDSAIVTIDYAGRLLYMNDQAAHLLGNTAEKLTGKTMHDVFPEPDATLDLEYIRRCIETNQKSVTEFQFTVMGEPRWFHVAIQPIHDANGQVTLTLINATDINDLKTAQQELLELNQSLEERIRQRTAEVQDLYDNAPAGYHSLDEHGTIMMINQTELNWLGYTREELVGVKNFRDLHSAGSQQVFEKEFQHLVKQGWIKNIEIEVLRKDGSLLPVLLNATAIYDESGKFIQSRATMIDITERKKVEKALRASEARLNFMLSRSPAGIFTADLTDGLPITFISDSVRNILGYEPRQYLEDSGFWRSRVHPDDLGPRLDEAGQALREQGQVVWESRVRRADGEYRWTSTGASLVRDKAGRPTEMIGYLVDIHETRQAQDALKNSEAQLRRSRDELSAANAALEKAARAKDEFLASMSHELRTPLTGILGLSEALQYKTYGDLSPKQENALKNIEVSGRHLLALINDILDISKIEAGQLTLQVEPCLLVDICRAALQLTKGMAHQKNQNVSFKLEPDPILMTVDPRRLKQMLVNLLSNAIKFTPPEGSLGLLVAGSEAEQLVRLTVWDNGIGIKPEDLPRLFQPFVQLDSSLARQNEGSGLGLSLVQRMTELHGGSVQVESALGQGSRFTILLPWADQDLAKTTQASGNPASARRARTPEARALAQDRPLILIVDDNDVTVQPMRDVLEMSSFRVVHVHSGDEMLASFGDIQPGLIIMDIQMPGMDGFEAIRQVRAHPEPRIAAIPIIAVTALAMTGDRERCLQAGANDYLSKPVQIKTLITKIIEITSPKSA